MTLLTMRIISNDNCKVAHYLNHNIKSRLTKHTMIQNNQATLWMTTVHNIKFIFKHDWWDVNHFKLLLKSNELKLSITLQINGIHIILSNGLAIKTSIKKFINNCNLMFYQITFHININSLKIVAASNAIKVLMIILSNNFKLIQTDGNISLLKKHQLKNQFYSKIIQLSTKQVQF